ncbi:MAG: hypothetical protein J5656_05890 [Clostridia bacterium]|nr:hypothetical protein [Clostridia bacterium]
MRFKRKETIEFCASRGFNSILACARAFNMGVAGFEMAIRENDPRELGRDVLDCIKNRYGEKVFDRIICKENNETWLKYDKEKSA